MLIASVFLRDTKVILQDVDGSEVELAAYDAWQLHTWIIQHQSLIFTAIRQHEERQRHGHGDETHLDNTPEKE